jgi:hypothetical protein
MLNEYGGSMWNGFMSSVSEQGSVAVSVMKLRVPHRRQRIH